MGYNTSTILFHLGTIGTPNCGNIGDGTLLGLPNYRHCHFLYASPAAQLQRTLLAWSVLFPDSEGNSEGTQHRAPALRMKPCEIHKDMMLLIKSDT